MTSQENKIPIKGYATFHPLKHCWIGAGFKAEWFSDLPIAKNKKVMDPLKRIADETEEDYQELERILLQAGVKTYRPNLTDEKYKSMENITDKTQSNPRDAYGVVGEKLYIWHVVTGDENILSKINPKQVDWTSPGKCNISTANLVRVGKDLFWDIYEPSAQLDTDHFIKKWEADGFRIHLSNRGYHSDGSFCVVKPGCIVSLYNVQDYAKEFPGWEVLYVPDQSWSKLSPFRTMREKVGGKWWLKGEEHNDQLIEFVNTWLNDWVGYVEETVFDVNMLSIDENTIICNNYNKEVFAHFKKHKVEPIIFNFRHRYFWDGGVHCITQDLYREGTMEDYFG